MSDREEEIEKIKHTNVEEIEFIDLLKEKLKSKNFNVTKISTARISALDFLYLIRSRNIAMDKTDLLKSDLKKDLFKSDLKRGGVKIETLSTLNGKKHIYENFMVILSIFERKGYKDTQQHGKIIFFIKGRSFPDISPLLNARDNFIHKLERTIMDLFL